MDRRGATCWSRREEGHAMPQDQPGAQVQPENFVSSPSQIGLLGETSSKEVLMDLKKYENHWQRGEVLSSLSEKIWFLIIDFTCD